MYKYFRCVVICSLLINICIFNSACSPKEISFYIFENIKECATLETQKTKESYITLYDSPSKDKNLNDLKYDEFYAGKYSSDELSFEIFAYQFIDSDNAKIYFKNNTGIETNLDTHYLASGGISKYNVIVIDNKNAYCINTKKSQANELMLYLSEVFSKKLK